MHGDLVFSFELVQFCKTLFNKETASVLEMENQHDFPKKQKAKIKINSRKTNQF